MAAVFPEELAERYQVKITEDDIFEPESETVYKISKRTRGKCIIINNTLNRKGTEVDAKGLKLVWEQLHFDVTVVNDLTSDDMILQMEQVAEECSDEDEAFICYILTHGTHNGTLFGNDNLPVKIDDLTSNFEEILDNKPKVFVIQACKGEEVTVKERTFRQKKTTGDNPENTTCEEAPDASSTTIQHDSLPIGPPKRSTWDLLSKTSLPIPLTKSDLLVCFATLEGQVAGRDINDGSDFIQCHLYALCNFAHCCDFMTIMQKTRGFMGELNELRSREQCFTENTTLERVFMENAGELMDGVTSLKVREQCSTENTTLQKTFYLNVGYIVQDDGIAVKRLIPKDDQIYRFVDKRCWEKKEEALQRNNKKTKRSSLLYWITSHVEGCKCHVSKSSKVMAPILDNVYPENESILDVTQGANHAKWFPDLNKDAKGILNAIIERLDGNTKVGDGSDWSFFEDFFYETLAGVAPHYTEQAQSLTSDEQMKIISNLVQIWMPKSSSNDAASSHPVCNQVEGIWERSRMLRSKMESVIHDKNNEDTQTTNDCLPNKKLQEEDDLD